MIAEDQIEEPSLFGWVYNSILNLWQNWFEGEVIDTRSYSYSPNTKTVCNGNICTLEIFSDIRYGYENNTWKNISEVFSLKNDTNFKLKYNIDPNYPLEVIDYNKTHIIIDFQVSKSYENEYVNLKFLDKRTGNKLTKSGGANLNKDTYIRIKDSNLKHREVIDLSEADNGLINAKIKWGLASTTVELQTADTENLEDSYISSTNPSTNYGSSEFFNLISSNDVFHDEFPILKFNISQIPINSYILDSYITLYLYQSNLDTGDAFDINTYSLVNETWSEDVVVYNDLASLNVSSDYGSTPNFGSDNDSIGYKDFDTISVVSDCLNLFESQNCSVLIKAENPSGDVVISDDLHFRSKEYGTSAQRPKLTITYEIEDFSIEMQSPSQASPLLDISAGDNITLSFLFKQNETNITDTFSFLDILIGSKSATIIESPLSLNLPIRSSDIISSGANYNFNDVGTTDYAIIINPLSSYDTVHNCEYSSRTTTSVSQSCEDDNGGGETVGINAIVIPSNYYSINNTEFQCRVKTTPSSSGTLNFPTVMSSSSYSFIVNSISDGDSPLIGVDDPTSKTTTSLDYVIQDDGGALENVDEISWCIFEHGETEIDGLRLKAGNETSGVATITVTFDTPFDNANYSAFLTDVTSYPSGVCYCEITSKSASNFVAQCADHTGSTFNCNTETFDWVAIEETNSNISYDGAITEEIWLDGDVWNVNVTINDSATAIDELFLNLSYQNIIFSHLEPSAFGYNPFISTWNTSKTSAGSSNSTSISLPLEDGGTYDFLIDWGDGNVTTVTEWDSVNATHDYTVEGEYTLTVNGTLVGFRFNNVGDKWKIIDISQWGDLRLGNSGSYFYDCENLNASATDTLDLNGTTSFYQIFREANSFNGEIGNWDVSKVTTFQLAFYNADAFNQDLNSWDTSNVTSLLQTFFSCNVFNQDLDNWNTSKVTNMQSMFYNSLSFNGNVSSWDTSSVIDMKLTFFNTALNQDLDSWDVSSVTDMSYMFYNADIFNGNVSTWDVSSVTDMSYMFYSADIFNGNVSTWNTSKVTDMSYMFYNADIFNGNVSTWDVSSVTDMELMFYSADAFNQNLSSWNVSDVDNFESMLNDTNLSVANYDSLLIGWNNLPSLNSSMTFGVNGLEYCDGESARANIISSYSWSIDGDSLNCGVNLQPNDPEPVLKSNDETNSVSSGLNCSSILSDPEGDTLNVFVYWYKNLTLNLSFNYGGIANETFFVDNLTKENLTLGDVWHCGMIVNDGNSNSTEINSSSIQILDIYSPQYNETDMNISGTNFTDTIFFWNVTWMDDGELDYWILSHNQTGSWVNSTISTNWINKIGEWYYAVSNFTITAIYGTDIYYRMYANDTAGNINQTGYGIVTVLERPYPQFTEPIPSSDSITYGDNWIGVDFGVTEEGDVDTWFINDSRFTINSTGYLDDGDTLGVLGYSINVSVNNTYGKINSTFYYLTVNQVTPTLTLDVTNSTYPTIGVINASESNSVDGDLTYNLYIDGVLSGTGSDIDLEQFNVGTYEVVYNTSGGINFSSATTTKELLIEQSASSCDVLFNESSPLDYPKDFIVWTNCDSTFTLYRNGSVITNNSVQDLSAGSWNFTVYRTDQLNYSSITDTELFTINQVTPTLTLDVTNSTYPTIGVINASESNSVDGDLTYNLYIDGVLSGTGSDIDLEQFNAGTYEIVYNTSGGINFSSATTTKELLIEQSTDSCSINFNETNSITYPNTFLVWHNCTSTATLRRNGTIISNNSIQSLTYGTWNFSVFRTDTTNYSNTYDEELFRINIPYMKASTIETIIGTNQSVGTIPLLFIADSNVYHVDETTGSPAFLIEINFTNFTTFDEIKFNYSYDGNPAHIVELQMFNGSEYLTQDLNFESTGIYQNISFPIVDYTQFNISNKITARIVHTSAGNMNHDFYIDYIILEYLNDTNSPQFTEPTPSSDSITYGDNWTGVDFDATDDFTLDTWFINDSRFTINSTGYLDDGDTLGVLGYSINVSVNDSFGNINSTVYYLTVNQATPTLTLDVTNSTYPTIGVINASESNLVDNDVTYTLYLDGVSQGTGSDIDLEVINASTYEIVYNTSGGTNFTSATTTKELLIEQSASSCDVLFNESSPIVNGTTFLAWTNCDTDFSFYLDGTPILNNSEQVLSIATWNFTVTRNDTTNYLNTYDVELFVVQQQPNVTTITTSVKTCRYKKLAYYNLNLAWFKESGCL